MGTPCPDDCPDKQFLQHFTQIAVSQAPKTSLFPPVIKQGVFFACPRFGIALTRTGGCARNGTFCCKQFLKNQMDLCKCSHWGFYDPTPKLLRMHFLRTAGGASIEFWFSKGSGTKS